MKIYTYWGLFYKFNTSFMVTLLLKTKFINVSIKYTGAHCPIMCQILFQLELSWSWFQGNGCFRDFLNFYVPFCSKKLSVQCGMHH